MQNRLFFATFMIAGLWITGCGDQGTTVEEDANAPWGLGELPAEPNAQPDPTEERTAGPACELRRHSYLESDRLWTADPLLSFAPGGRLLITGDYYFTHESGLEPATGEFFTVPASATIRALSSDWSRYVSGDRYRDDLAVYGRDGRVVHRIENENWIVAVALSSNGSRLAYASCDGETLRVKAIDLDSGELVGVAELQSGECEPFHERVTHIDFLPDHERLLVATPAGRLHLLDLTRQDVASTRAHEGFNEFNTYLRGSMLYDLAVSPDGKQAATTGADGFLKIWRTDTLVEVVEFREEISYAQINRNRYAPWHVMSPLAWSDRGLARVNPDGHVEIGPPGQPGQILETREVQAHELEQHVNAPAVISFGPNERLAVGYDRALATFGCDNEELAPVETMPVSVELVGQPSEHSVELKVSVATGQAPMLAGYRLYADGESVSHRFEGDSLLVYLSREDFPQEITVEAFDGRRAGSSSVRLPSTL